MCCELYISRDFADYITFIEVHTSHATEPVCSLQ